MASRELGSMGGDDAEYVLLAKALASFRGYVVTWGPGPPSPHTLYPPAFPILLSPFAGPAPESFLACHVLVALLGAGAVLLLATLFARRGLPPWAAAAAALAPALSLWWLRCAADVLSELPFLFFAAAALLALDPGEEDRLPARRIVLGAVLAGLAFYTRTAGLALVLPVAAALSLDPRTRGRAAWIAAGSLLAACGAWFLYGRLAGSGGYAEQLAAEEGGLLMRAWRALTRDYLPGTPSYLFPHPGALWSAAGWILWIAGGAGLVLGFRRRGMLALPEAFLLACLAMQSAWPFRDPRFALPVAALLGLFALEGVAAIAARRAVPVATALAAALLLPNLVRLATHVLPRSHRERPAAVPGTHEPAALVDTWTWSDDRYRQAAPTLAAFLHACDLVRRGEIPGLPDGPVLATNPRVASLLCGRPAVKAAAGATPAEVGALVRERGVVLVLVDDFAGGEPLRAYRDSRPPGVERAFAVPGGAEVLRVRP